ncbi:Hypothetical protein HVR_LOCUS349 [uncultured virus]|nr:Hypothetical protein HVR_LOCUS349 [uncultured virus]
MTGKDRHCLGIRQCVKDMCELNVNYDGSPLFFQSLLPIYQCNETDVLDGPESKFPGSNIFDEVAMYSFNEQCEKIGNVSLCSGLRNCTTALCEQNINSKGAPIFFQPLVPFYGCY